MDITKIIVVAHEQRKIIDELHELLIKLEAVIPKFYPEDFTSDKEQETNE